LPQLRLERGWSVDVGGKPWSEAESADPARLHGRLKPGPGASASEVAAHQLDRIHSATLELVVERGYGAVTVRDMAGRAGVSTRSFYQHYSGKEECFLVVHDLIARRVLRGLAVSNKRAMADGQKTLLAIASIIREWERDPRAAHLMLVDVYDAGPMAIDHAHRTSRSLERRITAGDPSNISSVIARGVLAGVTDIAQKELLSRQALHMQDLSGGLGRWALACLGGSMTDLEELNQVSARKVQFSLRDDSSPYINAMPPGPDGDRALLVSAVERLLGVGDCGKITEKMVLTAAGVPRRVFKANFSRLEDCLALVLGRHTERALHRARKAGAMESSAAGAVYRGVVSLCLEIAQDPALKGICFGGVAGFEAVPRLRFHREVKAQISRFVAESIGSASDAEGLTIEASVGAFWGAIQSEVVLGNSNCLAQMTVPLTHLILAPTVGPGWTIEVMCNELDDAAQ
jgi:AcrR family transcriptional regulator